MNRIVITASDFKESGGWVLDTQFVPTMGMPYLLAHGLGNPVEDAAAEFHVPESGEYHLYVYTYNWVAPWHKDMAPGIFELYIDEKQIGDRFGDESTKWGWEHGGKIHLQAGIHQLNIHDLTGFEGRVGMIVLTDDPAISLPEVDQDLQK